MKSWASKQTGFTIVELLIVIVVIAILAAITVVAYNGIQNQANDSAVKSDLVNVYKKVAMYAINSDGFPNNDTTIQAAQLSFAKKSYKAAVFCYRTDGSAWGLAADSLSGKGFYVSNTISTAQPYTFGSVYGQSGADICPNIGVSSPGWRWFVQSAGGTWWTGVN